MILHLRASFHAICSEQALEAGRYREAECRARIGLAIAKRAPRIDPRVVARLWNARGIAGKYRGRFAAAARAYAAVHRVARTHALRDPQLHAALAHNRGGLEHARGRYARAEVFTRRALARRRAVRKETHPEVALDRAALGAILDRLGRHAEAENEHRSALATFDRRGRAATGEAAAILLNLAACLHSQGRAGEAEAAGVRARAMSARALGAQHPQARLAVANLEVMRQGRPPGGAGAEPQPVT